jgi:hypothetical protein
MVGGGVEAVDGFGIDIFSIKTTGLSWRKMKEGI